MRSRDEIRIELVTENSIMICIIEDNEAARTATTALVRSLGRKTRAFSCAEQYLASIADVSPSCLIVDVHMPGMSGIELQAALLASGDGTPIIFVTGFPDDRVRAQALERGAVAFLAKPFSSDALSDCIAVALRQCPSRTVD